MIVINCILGIDPGTEKTGYCFLTTDNTIILSGVITAPIDVANSVHTRIVAIVDILGSLIVSVQKEGYTISAAAIEDQFMSKNVMVVKILSRLVGALSYQIYRLGNIVPILIPPERAKKSIGFKSSNYKDIENPSRRRKAIHEAVIETVSALYDTDMQDDEAFATIIAYSMLEDSNLAVVVG